MCCYCEHVPCILSEDYVDGGGSSDSEDRGLKGDVSECFEHDDCDIYCRFRLRTGVFSSSPRPCEGCLMDTCCCDDGLLDFDSGKLSFVRPGFATIFGPLG